jgi:hypothetical protein
MNFNIKISENNLFILSNYSASNKTYIKTYKLVKEKIKQDLITLNIKPTATEIGEQLTEILLDYENQ